MGWGFGVWSPWPDFSWLIHLCAEVKRNVLWSFALATITIQSAWSALAEATGDWSGWCGMLFGYKLRSKHAFHCSSRFDLFQHFQPVAEELFQDSPPKRYRQGEITAPQDPQAVQVSSWFTSCHGMLHPTGSHRAFQGVMLHQDGWDPLLRGSDLVERSTRIEEHHHTVMDGWHSLDFFTS